MPDVPGDEFYRHLPLHAPRQPDHRPVAAEDRPELPHGAVLADLFRRPRSAECLWICCGKNGRWNLNKKFRVTISYSIMYLQPYFFLVELLKMSKGLPI